MHVRARPAPLTPTDLRALAQFRMKLRHFLHFSEQSANVVGLEPQQHQLLLALAGLPDANHPPTIGAVAEWLQVQPNTAVELVCLTDAGESILRDLSLQHRAELRTAAPALSLQYRAELRTAAPALLNAPQAVVTQAREATTVASR